MWHTARGLSSRARYLPFCSLSVVPLLLERMPPGATAPSSSPRASPVPAAAIAGIAAGSIVLVATVALLAFFLTRRRRRRRALQALDGGVRAVSPYLMSANPVSPPSSKLALRERVRQLEAELAAGAGPPVYTPSSGP
ncbi:hypothetical protein MIND_00573600 [Mycena indigotica]|uniref:Uncharacterized protein n=1 Tax=Mycena indigotica TaxID=2126181 RepID=A0A8H6SPH4_9AGAR|nr:uncharacterized protein MIND_00573600 [Mycena indigotica]KAF7303448.1 hypothetical protein MIND_00573600 [Mycena indigotica]